MSNMLQDAQETPARLREFLNSDNPVYKDLGARLRRLDPAVVATIARGSSDHAASYGAYLIPQCTGRPVASIPPSVVTVEKAPLNLRGQFALAISQSGGSPDIVSTLEAARSSGALTAALVNQPGSVLERTGEVFLSQHAGVEKSLAATKTVLCSMAAVARIAGEWSGDAKLLGALGELPDVLKSAFDAGMKLDDSLLKPVTHAFVLSRAYGFCAAQETALKIKETCGLHSEAFSTAEVRHGPREIVNEKFLVIALALPGADDHQVVETALELKAQGARVLIVGPRLDDVASAELPRGSDPRVSPLVALQLLYPWLARSSKALGRDPDHPKYLKSKQIKTL